MYYCVCELADVHVHGTVCTCVCVYTCVCVCVYAVVIDEAQQAEALLMLNTILQFESRATSDVTADDAAAAADGDGDVEMECSEGVARVTHSLAMLHYLLHDSHQALHALLLYTLSPIGHYTLC